MHVTITHVTDSGVDLPPSKDQWSRSEYELFCRQWMNNDEGVAKALEKAKAPAFKRMAQSLIKEHTVDEGSAYPLLEVDEGGNLALRFGFVRTYGVK